MVYRISAPTPEEKDEWIHSIKYVNERLMRYTSEKCLTNIGQPFV